MSQDYTPIDCAIYSQYELHIMHKDILKVCWNDVSGISHIEVLAPFDLRAAGDGEYLHAKDRAGNDMQIRLDRILEFSLVTP